MKNIIVKAMLCAAFLFSASTLAAVAQTQSTTKTTKKVKTEKVVYTCPMHHDVIAYKPGKCPKPNCGMTLVKKTVTKKTTTSDKTKM